VSISRIVGIAALALAAFVGWGIYRAGLNETPPPPSTTDIIFEHGIANGERITTRSWTADYDRIVTNADQTVLDLQNVRNGIIYKRGKPYLRVRAAQMTVNTLTRDFSVTGPLYVATLTGSPKRSFRTTAARWSDGLQRLELPARVTIESGASAPHVVSRLTVNVKTGDVEVHDVAGPIRFK
jgi:hypothetical protein